MSTAYREFVNSIDPSTKSGALALEVMRAYREFEIRLMRTGCHRSSLSERELELARELRATGQWSVEEIALEFGVSRAQISLKVPGKRLSGEEFSQRCRKGIAKAKAAHKRGPGRPPKLSPEQARQAMEDHRAGTPKTTIAKHLRVTVQTLNKAIERLNTTKEEA